MEFHPGFRYPSSCDVQRRRAEPALTLLRLWADIPPGQWVDERHGGRHEAVQDQAWALAGGLARDDLLLSVLNLNDVLLRLLVAATGVEQEVWLDRVDTDYIAPMDPDGTGVWGPEELAL